MTSEAPSATFAAAMARSSCSLAPAVRLRRRGVSYARRWGRTHMNTGCEKCGGALYVDREAVLQVARRGFRGGRVFCVAGCTDVWLIEPARTMTERAVKPPDGRGKYPRTVRTVSCRVCERHYQSRGTKPGRCKACRTEEQRTRDRLRRLPLLNPAGDVHGKHGTNTPESSPRLASRSARPCNPPRSKSRSPGGLRSAASRPGRG